MVAVRLIRAIVNFRVYIDVPREADATERCLNGVLERVARLELQPIREALLRLNLQRVVLAV